MDFGKPFRKKKSEIKCEAFYCLEIQLRRLVYIEIEQRAFMFWLHEKEFFSPCWYYCVVILNDAQVHQPLQLSRNRKG